jgi:cytochrome c2
MKKLLLFESFSFPFTLFSIDQNNILTVKKIIYALALILFLMSCENKNESVSGSEIIKDTPSANIDSDIDQDEVISQEEIDGGGLFRSKCAQCHAPHIDGTAPKLFNVRKKWLEAGTDPEDIYLWVKDWELAIKESQHAKTVSQISEVKQNKFPDLSRDEINAIFNWVDLQPEPPKRIGQLLFNSKCATCHSPHKDQTGPKLYNVRDKWVENGAGEFIYTWVRNWEDAVKQSKYAEEVSKVGNTSQALYPDLKNEEIDAIFDWIDVQERVDQN